MRDLFKHRTKRLNHIARLLGVTHIWTADTTRAFFDNLETDQEKKAKKPAVYRASLQLYK